MRVATPRAVEVGRPSVASPAGFGLLSVVEPSSPSSTRWLNGITYEHASCGPVSGFSGLCADEVQLGGASPDRVIISGDTYAVADPFTLYATHTCSPIGSGFGVDHAVELATERLQRHQQEGIEREIGSGDLATEPNFLGATDLTVGSPMSVEAGFGMLADHAASVFGAANSVIHAPRMVSGHLPRSVARYSGHLELITGELVSLGGGYPNVDPAGAAAAPSTAWMYVTPPVLLLASDIRTIPPDDPLSTLDRSTNDLEAVAERTYVVTWDDCPIGAVLVSID